MTQQEFLQHAMHELGMTHQQFAERIETPLRTLRKWLLPDDSSDARQMPGVVRVCVREILKNSHKSS